VHRRDLLMLVGAALLVLVLIVIISDPIRLLIRSIWVSVT
jgi:hypothetical protein